LKAYQPYYGTDGESSELEIEQEMSNLNDEVNEEELMSKD